MWAFRDPEVARADDRLPPLLPLCQGCKQYVLEATEECPHCGGDVAALRRAHEENLAEVHAAAAEVRRLLAITM